MSIILQEDLEKAKTIEGEIIGSSLKTDRAFIIEKQGMEGLKKVEAEMEKLGYPLKYEEIDKYKWYPVQQDFLSLLLTQKIFNWDNKTIQEWGRWGAKTNFVIKLMARLVSKETISKLASKYWKKYYTKGEIEFELNNKKKIGIVTIKDFAIYDVHARFLEGYFHQIMCLMVPSQKLRVEKSKYIGSDIHQFKVSW